MYEIKFENGKWCLYQNGNFYDSYDILEQATAEVDRLRSEEADG